MTSPRLTGSEISNQQGASLRRSKWRAALAVFFCVFAAQLWFVSHLGSEVPWGDSWGVEGRWFYPTLLSGELTLSDWVRAHNEHRIIWTHLLNAVLFVGGGQWDPLAQQMAGVVLRAAAAGVLAWSLCVGRGGFAIVVIVAYLPVLAWHNVLWGFQSHVFFALGWGAVALWLLGPGGPPRRTWFLGVAAALASMASMGSGFLIPVAWLSVTALRMWRQRRWHGEMANVIAAAILFVVALSLRVEVPGHNALQSQSFMQGFRALAMSLAWPHVKVPWAALVINLPLAIAVIRSARRIEPELSAEAERALGIGFWGVIIAAAGAWTRGGSAEFAGGLPSRYVDFAVLVPLANAWWLLRLASSVPERRRMSARWLAGIWCLFILAGAVGLGRPVWDGLIVPRLNDRDVAVRLLQEYQQSGDDMVFFGRPRLHVPNPDLRVVRDVLVDERMRGHLPPALQSSLPMGWLARFLRVIRRHADGLVFAAVLGGVGVWIFFRPVTPSHS